MTKYRKIEGFTEEEFNEKVPSETKEVIKDFLRQSQRSEKTTEQYKSALYIFAKFVHDELDNKPIDKLKIRDALTYQNYLIDLGLSNSAVKFKRSSVSSLFNHIEAFWSDEYPNVRNIFTKAIPTIGNEKKKKKEPLTKVEINRLKRELEKREDWQKLAYLLFTYSTGCRREESRQLRKEVVNYSKYKNVAGEEKNYYVTHDIRAKGKGREGKIRNFSFDEETMIALKKWIEVRGEDDCEFMFVSNYNKKINQISSESFNGWTDTFGKILGKKVHPHLIRSSRATNSVVEDGKDIKAVQELLGHNSVETTEIYVVRDKSNVLDELYD